MPLRTLALLMVLLFLLPAGQAADRRLEVTYPASDKPGELSLGVTYAVWIPDSPQPLRGVIVHQHGCGTGACQGGATASDDLHWQALARKWNCALLGPSYHQVDGQNCRLWCDPRNGSSATFLRCLTEFSELSGRPELKSVPWCLWGHSGGGFWASLMQTMYPERIVAIWFRSGTAFQTWEKGEIPKPEIPAAAYGIPAMCNPGAKENGDARFSGAWTGAMAMFKAYRAKGAPIAFTPDPRTAHECGDSRYMAIPFFDSCLALRLPEPGAADQSLRAVDASRSWLAVAESSAAVPAKEFQGDRSQAVWLADERTARAWMEYVQTGAVTDTTPPPAPHALQLTMVDGRRTLTWHAAADFESGLTQFVILRDGKEVGQHPSKPVGRFGRALFQTMSYHDTPEKPLPALTFSDPAGLPAGKYQVLAINSAGLRSEPSEPATEAVTAKP